MPESASPPSALDAAPAAPDWQVCGLHRSYVHGDVVFLQFRGAASETELATLLEPIWQTQQRYGRAFVMLDASAAVPITADQRRFLATWYRDHPTQGGTVVFGASIVLRATVALLNAAARLLSGRSFVQERFVATEEHAWQALREARRKLLSSPSEPR